VQLTAQIYSRESFNFKVSEAIANMCENQSDMEVTSRQALTDALRAIAGAANGLAQIDALNVAVESGQDAGKGNRIVYKLGIRINIDVLNAEQQLFAAQRDLSKALYDTLLQGFKLKAAAGTLSEDDLLAVNALLH
jgi:outer membrane protein